MKNGITKHLEQYKDVFASDPSKMASISHDVMEHKLCVDSSYNLVIQKRRHLGVERSMVAATKV